ncbi:hypothetical protein HYY27_09745 [bacterium]|nr:hypothetical protein [bacterium]
MEGFATDVLPFVPAMLGYAGLSAVVLRSARGELPEALWRVCVVVIVTHVALVWGVRYQGQLSQAMRNGYAGFLIFHGALGGIVASALLRGRAALALVRASFAVVTLGAVGAVFRYEAVAVYRVPVLLCAAAGVAGLARVCFQGGALKAVVDAKEDA